MTDRHSSSARPERSAAQRRGVEGPDYPAAHSMDTAWFAIDRDGKVAYFETGEAGAIPGDAVMDEGAAWEAKDALPVNGGERRVLPVATFAGQNLHQFVPFKTATGLFYLKGEAPLAAELASGRAQRVPAEGVIAVRVPDADKALSERVHATGECLACQFDAELEDEPPIASRGLYYYTHDADNWVAGSYVLAAKPIVPLTADALPDEVRAHAVRFEGSFDETAAVQPWNVWPPCETWGAAWLDQDGKTVRPVPGREDDYAEEVEGLLEDPAFAVEGMPAGAARPAKRAPAPKPAKPWWKIW